MNNISGRIVEMEHISYDLGPITISFFWDREFNEVGSALRNWFGKSIKRQTKQHIMFVISEKFFDEIQKTSSFLDTIQIWAWNAALIYTENGNQIWVCKPHFTTKKRLIKELPRLILKFLNPLFASYWELQAGYLLYHIVLKILYRSLLANRATFVHAAGIADSFGNAVLICGKGGIGKTTTAVYFVSRGNWKIIADDFVVVTEGGDIYDSHLPAHIYGYHKDVFEQIGLKVQKLLKEGWLDILHWNIYCIFRPSKVVRRVSLPRNIKVQDDSKLKVCFIVEVVPSVNKISIQRLNYEDASQLSIKYTLSEIGVKENMCEAIKVMSTALRDAICYKLTIGENNKNDILAKSIFDMAVEILQI